MTTNEKLEKIAAKCRANLALAERLQHYKTPGDAEAGWRSTIAAIEWSRNFDSTNNDMCVDIIHAWPDELL